MLNFSSIGNRLIMGFQGQTSQDSGVKSILQTLEKGRVGGVLLFSYNIDSPKQLKELTDSLKKANPSILIAVDQEGGRVQRLRSTQRFHDFPSAKQVVSQYSEKEAFLLYQQMAKELALCGFNVNFAPVVDLHADSCAIGASERCFSGDPKKVAEYARAFVRAHREKGIFTTLKHFPGLGFARGDTHRGLVDITESFQPQELAPFGGLIKEGFADMVMVGHVMHREWDPKFPATLSPLIISEQLRRKMGFEGVVVADDLGMGAVAQHFDLEERVVRSIQGGCDLLIFSNNPAANPACQISTYDSDLPLKVFEMIEKAVRMKDITLEQLEESDRRLGRLSAFKK